MRFLIPSFLLAALGVGIFIVMMAPAEPLPTTGQWCAVIAPGSAAAPETRVTAIVTLQNNQFTYDFGDRGPPAVFNVRQVGSKWRGLDNDTHYRLAPDQMTLQVFDREGVIREDAPLPLMTPCN